jgi:hypothetical protein
MALNLLKINDVIKFLIFIIFIIASCKGNININKQYLPIINSSTKDSIFYQFQARGGERHLSLIDWGEDAIPTSAGSCHHGGEILPPQKGSIKAHLDSKNLYFNVYWEDKTKDMKSTYWDVKKNKWKDGKDDGIAIIFSKNPHFDCTTTCHMTDWQVGDSVFSSDYKMFTKDGSQYPLIILRAKKTDNKPILSVLGKNGKETPNHEPIYFLNTERLTKDGPSLMTYQTLNDNPKPKDYQNKDFFILNPNNIYLNGWMKYKWGGWHAYIEVPLEKINLSIKDRNDKIYMAIAIFDNTHANHSITKTFYAILQ